MTLLDLIRKAKETGDLFNTHEIPLRYRNRQVDDIKFEICEDDNDEYYVNLRLK